MKRWIAIWLAVSMLASVLTGCGGGGQTPTGGGQEQTQATGGGTAQEDYVLPDLSLDSKVELSWMMPTQNMLACTETPVMRYVAEKFNAVLSMTELAPADHDVQLELNISGKQIKNIVSRINISLANEYGSYGAFLDLRPYLEHGYLPNIKAMLDKAVAENPNNASLLYDSDGRIFRIPAYNENPIPNYNFSYNKEAFKAVGYENPQTWDDVYNALVAIKGGRDNYYPFQMRTLGNDQLGTQITNFIISFTGGYANGQEFIGYDPQTEQFQFALETAGYKEAIRFFNKMYRAGLIDPAFTTAAVGTVHEAMKSGECVMTCDFMGGYTGVSGYEEFTAAFVPMTLPQAPGREQTHGFAISQFDEDAGTVISADVAKNPVLLGRVLQILDYMYSEEFIRLQWYHPDICEGSYPEGQTDPTQYTYTLDESGTPIYKDSIYSPQAVADVQNTYFNWGIYANFYNLNDPVCNGKIAPFDAYYAFREALLTQTDKYVQVPLPIFNANQHKKINACEANMKTVFNMQIAELLTGSFADDAAFDARWEQAVSAIKDQGADVMVEIYNEAYQQK